MQSFKLEVPRQELRDGGSIIDAINALVKSTIVKATGIDNPIVRHIRYTIDLTVPGQLGLLDLQFVHYVNLSADGRADTLDHLFAHASENYVDADHIGKYVIFFLGDVSFYFQKIRFFAEPVNEYEEPPAKQTERVFQTTVLEPAKSLDKSTVLNRLANRLYTMYMNDNHQVETVQERILLLKDGPRQLARIFTPGETFRGSTVAPLIAAKFKELMPKPGHVLAVGVLQSSTENGRMVSISVSTDAPGQVMLGQRRGEGTAVSYALVVE